MAQRSRIWFVVGAFFFFINFAGAVFAAAQGELLHAGAHAGLLLLGAYIARRIWRRKESGVTASSRELTDSLRQLEQSVAAVAIDVERIGEAQRFITRLFTENETSRAAGEGATKPIDINARK
jgi:hypothetical protein